MPKNRTPRLCACGCGNALKELWSGARFKGYSGTYAPDCPNRDALRRRSVPSRAQRGMEHPRALPIGSRRRHDTGSGVYWLMKVSERGRWQYEHRVVAERKLGRKLRRGEIVHHRNEDTLDNSPDNIEVMTRAVHMRIHHGISGWSRLYDACVVCGTTERKHASRGRCDRCYQRVTYVPRK